jgi:predicted ATPase
MLIAAALRMVLPEDTALTGEISAEGLVRPVDRTPIKVRAALERGLRRVIIPLENMPEAARGFSNEVEVFGVRSLDEACEVMFRDVLIEKGYRAFPLAAATQAVDVRLHTPFIGRKHELIWLKQRVNRALSGKGGLCIVKGEAGIGKTRLMEEIQRYARDCGMYILHGQCLSKQSPIPYMPVIEAITASESQNGGGLSGDRYEQSNQLRALLKRIKEAADKEAGSASLLRTQLYEQILAFLGVLMKGAGVLFYIEDVHWGDSATLQLLYHIARRTRNQRLCLMLTYRWEEDRQAEDPENIYYLEILQRCAEEGLSESLALDPLSELECAMLMSAMLDDRAAPAWLKERLYKETQGNPLFLVETLKWWKDQGILQDHHPDWSVFEHPARSLAPRIQDTILRRLSRLKTEERELLEIAAVGGERFDIEEVIAIYEAPRLKVLRDVQRLERQHGILKHLEHTAYGFSHGKIQEVLYAQIPPVLRREYHTAWGRRLMARKESGGEVPVETLATHLYLGGDRQEALPYLIQAGERAQRMCAFREARQYWEQARALIMEYGGEGVERKSLAVLLNLGRVCYELGAWDVSINYNKQGLDIARRIEEIGGQAKALGQLGAILVGRNQWDAAIPLFEKSIEMFSQVDDQIGIASGHNYLGNIAHWHSQWKQAYIHYYIALEIVTKENDNFRIAVIANNIGNIAFLEGNKNKAIYYYNISIKSHKKIENILGIAEVKANIALIYERTQQWTQALCYHKESMELLETIAHSRHLWNAYINYARVLARINDLVLAKEILQKSYYILKDIKNYRGLAEAKRVDGLIAYLENNWDKAEVLFDESERLSREAEDPYGYAETLRERGDMFLRKAEKDRAIEYLQRAEQAFQGIDAKGEVALTQKKLNELFNRDSLK